MANQHRPAGDMRDDLKVMRGEINAAKEKLDELNEADANTILRQPRKRPRTSAREVGSHFESNRSKH